MGEEQLKHLQLTVGCVSRPVVKPHGSAQPFSARIVSDLPASRLQTLQKPHKSYICFAQSSVLTNTESLGLSTSGEGSRAFNSGQGSVKDQQVGSQLLCPASPSLSGHIVAIWDGKSLWLLPQTAMNSKHPVLMSAFLLRKTKAFCLDEVMSFNPTPAFTPHRGVGTLHFLTFTIFSEWK